MIQYSWRINIFQGSQSITKQRHETCTLQKKILIITSGLVDFSRAGLSRIIGLDEHILILALR